MFWIRVVYELEQTEEVELTEESSTYRDCAKQRVAVGAYIINSAFNFST